MNRDIDDHALYHPAGEPGMSPQALRSAIVLAPLGLVLWLAIGRVALWLLDALERAVYALAGAAFVIAIGASMTALVYWAIDIF